MSTPKNGNNQRLMLDVQATDSTTVPYEVFESSQGQLREAAVALSKHKSSLASALGEVNNLRSMVGALEKNVEMLKLQNEDLFEKLRESRKNEELLLTEVSKLTETTEFLSHQLQQHAKTAAQRYTALLELKEETEASLRVQIDRLSNQLLSSQHPQTRVIPWSYTFKQTDHPAHIVKLVVQADANRENRMMRLQLPATTSGSGVEEGGFDNNSATAETTDLEKLLNAANDSSSSSTNNNNNKDASSFFHNERSSTANASSAQEQQQAVSDKTGDIFASVMKSSGFAEDANTWRSVCRRLHQVLAERRSLLRTKTDGPLEFLLRTRHEMAASIVQMREDVKKLNVILNTMLEKMAGKVAATSNYGGSQQQHMGGGGGGGGLSASQTVTLKMFEGSIEILQTSLSDLNHTIQRALFGCLTDSDRVLLGLSNTQQILSRKSITSTTNTSSSANGKSKNNNTSASVSNKDGQQQPQLLSQRERGASTNAMTLSSSASGSLSRNDNVAATSSRSSFVSSSKRDML